MSKFKKKNEINFEKTCFADFADFYTPALVGNFRNNRSKKKPYTTEKKALKSKKYNNLGVFFVIHI